MLPYGIQAKEGRQIHPNSTHPNLSYVKHPANTSSLAPKRAGALALPPIITGHPHVHAKQRHGASMFTRSATSPIGLSLPEQTRPEFSTFLAIVHNSTLTGIHRRTLIPQSVITRSVVNGPGRCSGGPLRPSTLLCAPTGYASLPHQIMYAS